MAYTTILTYTLPEGITADNAAEWRAIQDIYFDDETFRSDRDAVVTAFESQYNGSTVVQTTAWSNRESCLAFRSGVHSTLVDAFKSAMSADGYVITDAVG